MKTIRWNSSTTLRALVAAVGVAAWAGSGEPAQAQRVFANGLPIATGIEADRTGNIVVQSDGLFTTYLTKYGPGSRILRRTTLGGATVGDLGHIARIPGSDDMMLLTQRGEIYGFGPGLRLTRMFDLSQLAFQVANNVYDVNLGFNGSLVLGAPDWGDIATFWVSPTLLYVYVTATTNAAGGFPFVVRLSLDYAANRATWRVVAKSSGTTVGNVSLARGIAVNSQGWVLAGFPHPGPAGFFDSLVAFRTSFPGTNTTTTRPRFVLKSTRTVTGVWDMASMGMATDMAGNFYVATGVVGSSLCGYYASGALVVIDKNPNTPKPRCFTLSSLLSRSRDVAVSPVGNIAYMTVDDRVVRFGSLTQTAGPSAGKVLAAPSGLGPVSAIRGSRLLGVVASPLVRED